MGMFSQLAQGVDWSSMGAMALRIVAVLLCLAAFLVLNSIVHARKCLDADMNAHLAKLLNMPLVKATIAKFTQHSTTV